MNLTISGHSLSNDTDFSKKNVDGIHNEAKSTVILIYIYIFNYLEFGNFYISYFTLHTFHGITS